jgi:hypothetical protein
MSQSQEANAEEQVLDLLPQKCVSAALYPKLLYALSEVYAHPLTSQQHAAIHRLIAWIDAVAEKNKANDERT